MLAKPDGRARTESWPSQLPVLALLLLDCVLYIEKDILMSFVMRDQVEEIETATSSRPGPGRTLAKLEQILQRILAES
jgi:hypothetical protein